LLIAMLGAGGVYYYGRQLLEAPGPLKEDKIVNIPQRAGKRDIAETLNREGVADVNPWVFIASVAALKASSDLKPGEYSFQKNASLRDVIATIVEGKVVQHSVTIPEGLTSEQIVARLSDNDIFTGSVRELPREGTLLPETYKFPRGTPRDQVIQRMQQAHKRVLAEIWERRSQDFPVKSPEQLVTLASIVEKETGKPDERSRVAAVFANRLKQKIKLQSDPTIIYGLVGGKGTLGRPIKRSEITQPSPYNTYVIEGLPPGPISNPGRASLEATANPARTRDLYFVADGNWRACLHRNLRRASEERRQATRGWKARIQNDTAEPAEDAPPAPPCRRRACRRPHQSYRPHQAGRLSEGGSRALARASYTLHTLPPSLSKHQPPHYPYIHLFILTQLSFSLSHPQPQFINQTYHPSPPQSTPSPPQTFISHNPPLIHHTYKHPKHPYHPTPNPITTI
jgi:UPF0755 protein